MELKVDHYWRVKNVLVSPGIRTQAKMVTSQLTAESLRRFGLTSLWKALLKNCGSYQSVR